MTPGRSGSAIEPLEPRRLLSSSGGSAGTPDPVFGPDGEAVAALEVRLRDVRAELPCVVPALTIAARALSRDLGPVEVPPMPARPAMRELSTAPVALRNSHATVREFSSRTGRRR